MSDEDRLREEAARRAERRRKKLEQGEERLARITGQPVGSGPRVSLDLPNLSYYEMPSSSGSDLQQYSPTEAATDNFRWLAGEDPPLEQLVRPEHVPTAGPDTPSPPPPVARSNQCSHLVWVSLAILSYLILQTSSAHYLSNSAILPFLLTFFSLCVSGHISLQSSSAASSLISAALMLCGLNPKVVSFLLSSLATVRSLSSCFAVYLLSLILTHVVWEAILKQTSGDLAAN